MRTVNIEETTYRRLTSIIQEIVHSKKCDINYDDAINELIDVYQENAWGHIGAGCGGG